MATRKIVKIDEDLCDGCGECVPSCAEGAIQIINGKARLVGDNLCDGLGACLGDCPQGAITIEEREAEAFDEEAVSEHMARQDKAEPAPLACGCPGTMVQQFDAPAGQTNAVAPAVAPTTSPASGQPSELRQWPVQLHLVPPTAPFFLGADLLLAADCTAFSIGDFHERYLKGRALVMACPKLDSGQEIYLQKLIAMIDEAKINTLTVLMMQVPCCGGLVRLAQEAVARASRKVPVKQIVVGVQGEVLKEEWC